MTFSIQAVTTLANAHPYVTTLVAWPLLSAGVTWLFKPHTKEELAAANPRVAAILELVAAAGFNAVGVRAALRKLLGLPAEEPQSPPGK